MSEAAVQQNIRLAAARHNAYLWRNNSGAFQEGPTKCPKCGATHSEATGRWIRYGLANDSKKLNEEIKSSDLIGPTPVVITPDMVGQTVAVFTAIEVKPEGWPGIRSARERAQAKFITLVRSLGGYAGFATSVEEAVQIMEGD